MEYTPGAAGPEEGDAGVDVGEVVLPEVIEGLPAGLVAVHNGRGEPHQAQHQQSEKHHHHHRLIDPGQDTLSGASKALRFSEEVCKGHEEDEGQVGEEKNKVPEAQSC